MLKLRKTLENITPYAADEYRKEWYLKLDSNENIYGCSKYILNAIRNINKKNISLYPCYGEFLDLLAKNYGYSKENYLITNGCDEALNIIINTYLNEKESILSYSPSFSMPSLYAKVIGGEIQNIEYDKKYVFDVEKIKSSITNKTKIVYIATPNNPTGEVVKSDDIEKAISEFKNVLFIIDCTYVNFSYEVNFEDYAKLVENNENVCITKSFSKDFALAGLRLGFVLSNKEIIKNLKKVASPYNVNAVAIHCAAQTFKHKKDFENIKKDIKKSKNLLFEGLKKLGFIPYKSEGNFILCDFLNYSDFYYEKLKKNGIIVRKYSKDSSLASCLRITVPQSNKVDFILKLLQKKNLLIFDLDGVVFDVNNSYMQAIKATFEHFSKTKITINDVKKVKNLDNMNCDYDAVDYLLKQEKIQVPMSEIINVFQDLFYRPDNKKDYLIDKEKLQIPKKVFEKISKKYDFAVFSGREMLEAKYSLEKFDVDKYFYYYITSDKLKDDEQKPSPVGLKKILSSCPYKDVKYLGDSIDDIKAGLTANVTTIGILDKKDSNFEIKKQNFENLKANGIIADISKLDKYL